MGTSESDVASETDACEKCGCELGGEVAYIEDLDERWCHSCADNAAEAAYDDTEPYQFIFRNGRAVTVGDDGTLKIGTVNDRPKRARS